MQIEDGKWTIGVLALQGAFVEHCQCLKKLSTNALEIREAADLKICQGLIIPGGESTTMMNLIDKMDLREALTSFAAEKPIWGTCAGLILLAKEVENAPFTPLGVLDIRVQRNAYGRQISSFLSSVQIHTPDIERTIPAFFIRAPKIQTFLSNDVESYGHLQGECVFVRQNNLFATTFHSELTCDLTLHQLFINSVKEVMYV